MFESLKSFKYEPTEECEECLAKDFLVDAIIDGKQKRICQHCVVANNAIVLKKPAYVNLERIERDTVSDVMKRLTGIEPKRIERPQPVKLEDLRKRYEERKAKRKSELPITVAIEPFEVEGPQKFEGFEVLDENEFKNYIEMENQLPQSKFPTSQLSTSQELSATQSIKQTPSILQTSQRIQQDKISNQDKISDAPLDFSPEATKKTTIRDILEKMKLIGKKETKEIEGKIEAEAKVEEKKENKDIGKKEGTEEKI